MCDMMWHCVTLADSRVSRHVFPATKDNREDSTVTKLFRTQYKAKISGAEENLCLSSAYSGSIPAFMSKIDPKCSLIIQGQHNGPGNYTFHSTRWKVVQALASETRPKKMPFFLPMMLLNVLWPCLSCNYLWQFPLVCWSKSHHDSVLCFCMSFQSMFFLSS